MIQNQVQILKLKSFGAEGTNALMMNWKTVPYFIMLAFTIIVTIVRIFMIPEWSIFTHLLLFVPQYILLLIIWAIINQLGKFFDKRLPFTANPIRRMIVQSLSSILCVTPVIVGIILSVRPYMPAFANDKFITLIIILLLVMTVLLNILLAAFYFFNQWQASVQEKAMLQVKTAEMEKERSMLQYHHLKNQVNPHFLFNTFSSLDGLIQTDANLASDFVRHLSKVYRYVLEHKENEVVSLQTEADFIQNYISLLNIRYKNNLRIDLDISAAGLEKGIVMVTLQMLLDNAIKHNSMHSESILHVRIWDEDGYLHVRNNKQLRRQIETSNKQGLQQLKELYSYISQRPIIVSDTPDSFQVNLPLL
jgi:hypothetical protein